MGRAQAGVGAGRVRLRYSCRKSCEGAGASRRALPTRRAATPGFQLEIPLSHPDHHLCATVTSLPSWSEVMATERRERNRGG